MKLIGTAEEIEALLNGLLRHRDMPPVSADELRKNYTIYSYLGYPILIEIVDEGGKKDD